MVYPNAGLPCVYVSPSVGPLTDSIKKRLKTYQMLRSFDRLGSIPSFIVDFLLLLS